MLLSLCLLSTSKLDTVQKRRQCLSSSERTDERATWCCVRASVSSSGPGGGFSARVSAAYGFAPKRLEAGAQSGDLNCVYCVSSSGLLVVHSAPLSCWRVRLFVSCEKLITRRGSENLALLSSALLCLVFGLPAAAHKSGPPHTRSSPWPLLSISTLRLV